MAPSIVGIVKIYPWMMRNLDGLILANALSLSMSIIVFCTWDAVSHALAQEALWCYCWCGQVALRVLTTQMWPFLKDRRKIIYSAHVDNFPLLWFVTYVVLLVCFMAVQGLALVAARFFLVSTSYKRVSGLSRGILSNCGLLAACSGLRLVCISCSATPLLTWIRL